MTAAFLRVLLLVIIHIWLTIATQIFYVLPDNPINVSCSSQPCATLSQYLLDNNGTLPVVSNVEYHFLPGEHQIPTGAKLNLLYNFTLMELQVTSLYQLHWLVAHPSPSTN